MTKAKIAVPAGNGTSTEPTPPAAGVKAAEKAPEPEVKAKPEVEAKAPPAPKAPKKESTQDMLARIREESLSRVNMDNFLSDEGMGRFDVPKHLIPDGFSVEWKNTHVRGEPVDAAYQLRLRDGGWMVAPVELFKEMVPDNYDGTCIERDGQILMIRPIELTQKAQERELNKANSQMGDKMRQLSATDSGQMDRIVQKVNKTYEKGIPTE